MKEFSDDVQERITAALVRLGVSAETAGMVGAEITADISRCWSGERVYIGKKDQERARIIDVVRRKFNGRNARELARELGVGRATIYRYIKIAGRAPAGC